MKNILHIMNDSDSNRKYNLVFADQIENNKSFQKGSNQQLFMWNQKLDEIPRLVKTIVKADMVILHQLSEKGSILYSLIPGMAKKTRWVVWGGDLYNYSLKEKNNFIAKISEFLKKNFVRKIDGVGVLNPETYEYLVDYTGSKARMYQVFYKIPIDYLMIENAFSREEENTASAPTFMIGNSAVFTNNHIEIFEILNRIDDNDIQIICPLSYGDKDYATEVATAGLNLFGNRFYPLMDFLSPEEYTQILVKVDVAVFNHDRPQGIGNIIPLLYMGKKVYLKKETSTYALFESLGIKVFDTGDLAKETKLEKVVKFDQEVAKNNKQLIERFFSESNFNYLWQQFLDPDQ